MCLEFKVLQNMLPIKHVQSSPLYSSYTLATLILINIQQMFLRPSPKLFSELESPGSHIPLPFQVHQMPPHQKILS